MQTLDESMNDDLISREAVWNVMQELWGTSGELMDRLMALPPVTPKQTEITLESAIDYLHSIGWLQKHDKELTESAQKQRTGHWIKTKEKRGGISEIWYNCSECGWRNSLYLPRSFCPNCGTDMREPKESENVANPYPYNCKLHFKERRQNE